MSAKHLRVLCIHGYRQDASIFKSKCGGFRKLFKKVEFIFFDAPHLIPKEAHDVAHDDDGGDGYLGRGWWFVRENPDFYNASVKSDICKGYDESLKLLKRVFDEQGPFDGILGFSQGASFVSLISCLKQLNEIDVNFNFAILVAAFKSLSSSHLQLYERLEGQLIEIPSLHIFGENDQVIGKERSQELTQLFSNPKVITHSGGHLMPSSSSFRNECNQFFNSFQK